MTTAILLASAAVMATPQTDPNTWIGSDDYPTSAIAFDEEGVATVSLEVDEAGKASACAVSSSSGSAELDNLTCSLLMERARFSPARDQGGRAIKSTYVQRVSWRMSREELVTQGFKVTYAVAPNGELSDCQIEEYQNQDDDIQCDPEMVEVTAETYLPYPLSSYEHASIMLAMEVEDSGIVVPRRLDEDRSIISRAFLDVSADGVVTACRSDVARSFMGQLADLCAMAVEVGRREFEPDPERRTRRFSVTLEVSGKRR